MDFRKCGEAGRIVILHRFRVPPPVAMAILAAH
jgi:hypothetical protein